MRLMDALASPGAERWVIHADNSVVAVPGNGIVIDFEGTIRVVADEVWRMYWQDETDCIDMHTYFGPLRLPYPALWVEGNMPTRVYADGEWKEKDYRLASGALFNQRDDPHQISMSMCATSSAPEEKVLIPVAGATLYLDDSYGLKGFNWISDHQSGKFFDKTANNSFAIKSAYDILRPALLALSLMNCKNVDLQEVRRPAPRIKHSKNRGRKPIRFSRIVLPAPRSGRSSSGGFGGDKSLHMVRGHFKTYTDESKLFGRLTGTYWWDWQARGSKKVGTVVPTYEIGAPT